MFCLGRIHGAELTERTFEPPADFNIQAYALRRPRLVDLILRGHETRLSAYPLVELTAARRSRLCASHACADPEERTAASHLSLAVPWRFRPAGGFPPGSHVRVGFMCTAKRALLGRGTPLNRSN